MDKLAYSLKQLQARNRDGSFATRNDRARILSLCVAELKEAGFKTRQMVAEDLKGRHVNALLDRWQSDGLATGTIKNRLAAIRWWAEKVDKASILPRDNATLGIGQRKIVGDESKAVKLSAGDLHRISDAHVRLSLELQAAFGLRREESIKFNPSYADKGSKLVLKPSWTKGGRPREIPIRTEAQRDVLNRARELAGRGSLIPPDRNYVQQLRVYEKQTARAGLHRLHGLRHEYAQKRYHELTGRLAPSAGGKHSRDLTPDEKRADTEARMIISSELGHGREQITAVYLGR